MPPVDIQTLVSRIPKIHDVAFLAQGGQKSVFRARHEEYGDVAIKIIAAAQTDERAMREIKVATQYSIPHTSRLYGWGTLEDGGERTVFLIEEFVQGITLRQQLSTNGRLPIEQALDLLDSLLETAVAMEREHLVHRDIKPENIMVCNDGTFKLLDFGIARHLLMSSATATANHFGPHTAGYAAPEQFRNMKKDIDSRTDLFAIGVVTYEIISGAHPFADGARDHLDILHRTETVAVPPLTIPGDVNGQLAAFLDVLMSKYPSRRPPTARIARDWFLSIRQTMNPQTRV